MSYIATVAVLLLLPGLCVALLLGLRWMPFLFSISVSYSLYVLVLKFSQKVGMRVTEFENLYLVIILILVIVATATHIARYGLNPRDWFGGLIRYLKDNRLHLLAGAVILLLLGFYYGYAGSYLEVPSDVFQHMEYIQIMSIHIENSVLNGNNLPQYSLNINGKYWHYLYAFINNWNGTELSQTIAAASYVNNLIFLLGVYSFSLIVFEKMFTNKRVLILAALAVSTFYFLHFGVNIFSFLRYYAMAPVMLNMVLYFTVMAIAIRFFGDKSWPIREMIMGIIILYAGLHIHIQEMLFVVIIVLLMSGCLFFGKSMEFYNRWHAGEIRSNQVKSFLLDKATLVFIPLVAVIIGFHLYSYLEIARNPVQEPKLIPLENLLPFVKNLYILNPAYQFYHVVTLWGLAVIVLFALNWKRFRDNTFIVAGMLSPLLTVFNPVFVDLFLRHSHSIMLWRLSFLVPIYFVGGYLLVFALINVRNGKVRQKLAGSVTVLILVTLLLPINTTYIDAPYSRFLTLKKVDPNTSPEQWQDLLEYLNTIKDRKKVITDPVTGYLLSSMTKHWSERKKFYRLWGGYIDLLYDDYSNHPFDKYAGHLLIVNRRNGGMSKTGRIARHWPENILQVGNYYQSGKFDHYIESHPERFELLWERNRISVFLISRPGQT